MKTIFIMGILSFFCGISAAQPQYLSLIHISSKKTPGIVCKIK